MSVIMMLHLDGDPGKLEEYAAENQETMAGIVERAKSKGLIAHRFFGDDSGHIVVIDEWPDQGSFESFFGEAQQDIGELMQVVGVSNEPQPQFLRVLESHDKVGWES